MGCVGKFPLATEHTDNRVAGKGCELLGTVICIFVYLHNLLASVVTAVVRSSFDVIGKDAAGNVAGDFTDRKKTFNRPELQHQSDHGSGCVYTGTVRN